MKSSVNVEVLLVLVEVEHGRDVVHDEVDQEYGGTSLLPVELRVVPEFPLVFIPGLQIEHCVDVAHTLYETLWRVESQREALREHHEQSLLQMS